MMSAGLKRKREMELTDQITEHFTYGDLVTSSTGERLGLDNTPSSEILATAKQAAKSMEYLRHLLGDLPIHVDSWIRMPAVNKAVGGADDSAHLLGCAIDFKCAGYGAPVDIIKFLIGTDLVFDEIIQEGSWVHVSFDPRARRIVLTAHFVPGQKTTYTKGL